MKACTHQQHTCTCVLVSLQCQIELKGDEVVIESSVKVTHKTGVEMEALTAASVAALCVYGALCCGVLSNLLSCYSHNVRGHTWEISYDMCKALSHDIVIHSTQLVEKTGGKRDVNKQA